MLIHHQDDDHPDTFYPMNDQMTVFGFGRKGLTQYVEHVPRRFTILLAETTRHDRLHERATTMTQRKRR